MEKWLCIKRKEISQIYWHVYGETVWQLFDRSPFYKSNKCCFPFVLCVKVLGDWNLIFIAELLYKQTIQWTMCVCVFLENFTISFFIMLFSFIIMLIANFLLLKFLSEIKLYVSIVNLLLQYFQYNWHTNKQLWMCYCFLKWEKIILMTAS